VNDPADQLKEQKFTVPFIVYKMMPAWPYLDKIAENFHLFLFLIAMVLATQWQISGVQTVTQILFVSLCLAAADRLYQLRSSEKTKLNQYTSMTMEEQYHFYKAHFKSAKSILLVQR